MIIKYISPFLLCFLILGCSVSSTESPNSIPNENEQSHTEGKELTKREAVKLVRVIDGDTIEISYRGTEEKVRLLLIDTPETSHPRLGEQPFGQEAKMFTKEIVENAKSIEIEFDIGPKRDKYSRMLAYIYVDGKMLQEELLKRGLARVAYIYPPNIRYVDQFQELQEISRKNELGIWEIENYSTEDGFNPTVIEKDEKMVSSQGGVLEPVDGCEIKGNINSKGEKIYHTPESRSYEQTKPEIWFCNEQEAKLAGFRPPKR